MRLRDFLLLIGIALVLWLSVVLSRGATPVYFSEKDFTGQTINRRMTITPAYAVLTDGTNVYAGIPFSITNAVTTNLISSDYYVDIAGVPQRWRIAVPDSTNLQYAAALTTNVTVYPNPSATYLSAVQVTQAIAEVSGVYAVTNYDTRALVLTNSQNQFAGSFHGVSVLSNLNGGSITGTVATAALPESLQSLRTNNAVTLTNLPLSGLQAYPLTNNQSTATIFGSSVTATKYFGSGTNMTGVGTVIDVRDFGARGDGSTNDTAAIQAALWSVWSNGNKSVTVYLPAGTYNVDGLTIPHTVWPANAVFPTNGGWRMQGAGKFLTRLNCTNGMFMSQQGNGTTFEGFSLFGPGAWSSCANTGFNMGHPSFCGLINDIKIKDCAFVGYDYGIIVSNMWLVEIGNCTIISNRMEGIRSSGGHNLHIHDNYIGGVVGTSFVGGIGIGLHYPPACPGDNVVLQNNHITTVTNAIFNSEAMADSLSDHIEGCGVAYNACENGAFNIVGSYVLDNPGVKNWTNGFAAMSQFSAMAANRSIISGCDWDSRFLTGRTWFDVTNAPNGPSPMFLGGNLTVGQSWIPGLWNSVISVTNWTCRFEQEPIWSHQYNVATELYAPGWTVGTSPTPFSLAGSLEAPTGSQLYLIASIPHGLGFSNAVVEFTVQGAAGETNGMFSIMQYNYSIGPAAYNSYGGAGRRFGSITNGYVHTFSWTNAFGEDLYPRRLYYAFRKEDYSSALTNDLWIMSFRIYSLEPRLNGPKHKY